MNTHNKFSKKTYLSWQQIDWGEVTQYIWRIQREIENFAKQGNRTSCIELQNKIINWYKAKLLAIRRVPQDNRRKVPAGVDEVKKLTPK